MTVRPEPNVDAPRHRSADYIDRTVRTVRNHRDSDNCWPQWANVLADEIEDLRAALLTVLRPCVDCGYEIRSPHPVCRCGDCTEYGPPRKIESDSP